MKKSEIEAVNEFVALVGGKSWERTSHRCTGKWRGTTDYGFIIDGSITFLRLTDSDTESPVLALHQYGASVCRRLPVISMLVLQTTNRNNIYSIFRTAIGVVSGGRQNHLECRSFHS